MSRTYHEPTRFRYTFGAFLQAGRSVTFMVQSEKTGFSNFGWYDEWVEAARKSAILVWLNQARVEVVHQRALEPRSLSELWCLDGTEDDMGPTEQELNPFECTHFVVAGLNRAGQGHDPHDYRLVRRWELDSLPGRELLDATAEIYEELEGLNDLAHAALENELAQNWVGGRIPCMIDTDPLRVA